MLTSPIVPRSPTTILSTLGIFIFGALFALITVQRSELLDFRVYWHAAERLSAGETIYALLRFPGIVPGEERLLPYIYPPFIALFLSFLLPLGFDACAALWIALQFYAFALTGIFLARIARLSLITVTLGMICFWPLWYSLLVGQPTGLLTLLLAVVSWCLVERKSPPLRGVLYASMAAIKITPLFLLIIPVFRRQWRVVGSALVALGSLVAALTLHPEGIVACRDFFSILPTLELERSQPPVTFSLSPLSLWSYPPRSELLRMLSGPLAGAVMLLPCVFTIRLSLRPRSSLALAQASAIIAMVFLSPIVWIHHFPLLLVAAALYVGEEGLSPKALRHRGALALCTLTILAYGHTLPRVLAIAREDALDLIRLIPLACICSSLVSAICIEQARQRGGEL